ncbi:MULTISPECIES: 23S rRNA (guanosine(2251)-2'-O)-methyltransferase RlmB [Reichenbachiella]|uniref:23S rRNA (Guanosine2251-2'-O)-methyltransferase n=1 Tax=Reichenbachiella agariperforans TaxID=156994 RepID=A0A1M6NLG1_REIAG|nr:MULTISPECIES: 23S rRNA (guanosine(2251)-2'-O)-methyltransferase RlmB [Reichenbachiella]MBU2915925.1 23S rRNA (guanosine(2251)-2'-O)-methyltransferase RlmB [Reichenbachiella agariperforans]RJE71819.1 23S rRNA (guanosine(2251)-2'-O)-methyltransferase RlmB [Reichenbachiella sp. MSK19-1]SHJ96548.1 23S rRNA (guanosine2251-2'-O)-methyltransferase [Reichenbachiella agariperforans]
METRKYINYKKPKSVTYDNMVFGTRAVIETIKSGKTIDKIFLQKGLDNELTKELTETLRNGGAMLSVSRVPSEKLDRFTKKNHQGVVAFVSPIDFVPLHNIVATSYENGFAPLILILDRITDIRNFGAICRTAECVGVNGVVIPTNGAAMINSDAVKTSAGALNYLSIAKEPRLTESVKYLKDSGFQVIACTEKSDEIVYSADLSIPTAIIMGSEEDGVSDELLAVADHKLKIPILGSIQSLNVSVAAGIILYESMRQRS